MRRPLSWVVAAGVLALLLFTACNPVSPQASPPLLPPVEEALPTPTPFPTLPAPTAAPSPTLTPAAPVPGNPLANDTCGNRYFPIVAGASWVYEVEGSGTAIHTISSAENGSFSFTVESKDGEFLLHGKCEDGNISRVEVPQNMDGFTMELTGVSGYTLPRDVALGDEWLQNYEIAASGGDLNLSITAEVVSRALKIEQVEVPAGVFRALRIEQTSTMSFAGTPVETIYTTWYVEGIGAVRSVVGTDNGGNFLFDLLSYTIP